MASKCYLVTGATGFVGSHIAERLIKRGDRVRAIVRPNADTRLLDEWGVEKIVGDLTDQAILAAAVHDVDGVIHAAAKVGDFGPIADYRAVNVEATRSLVEVILTQKQPPRLVMISSLGVYPAQDHHATDESCPLPDHHIDGYTMTKAEADRYLLGIFERTHFPLVILRPGFVYGPRDRTVLPRILKNLKRRMVSYFGSPDKKMNNVFVGNVVQAVELALDAPIDQVAGRIYNLTDEVCVTKREFFETVADLAGLPRPTRTLPLWLAKTLCFLMGIGYRVAGIKPIVTSATIKFLGLNLDYSIAKAKLELGYRPTVDFQTGMREAVAWVQATSSAQQELAEAKG